MLWQGPLQAMADQGIDLTQASKRGCDEAPREVSVAGSQGSKAGVAIERVVQRLALVNDGAENPERGGPSVEIFG